MDRLFKLFSFEKKPEPEVFVRRLGVILVIPNYSMVSTAARFWKSNGNNRGFFRVVTPRTSVIGLRADVIINLAQKTERNKDWFRYDLATRLAPNGLFLDLA